MSRWSAPSSSRTLGEALRKIANAGHINAASGYGDWPDGEQWLAELREIRA
jgi:predicted alpha/beta hydrolase family esterase